MNINLIYWKQRRE